MITNLRRTVATLCAAVAILALTASAALAQVTPPKTVQIAASYTDKGAYDVYEVDASAGAVTLTLLAPAKRRQSVHVIKTDSSANAVTVATAGTGATVNAQSALTLASQFDAVTLVPNGKTGSSGVWRVVGAARRLSELTPDKTIATTGNTDWYVTAPEAGALVSASFAGVDALAASDTNYITFTVTNLGLAGAGSTVMLAATAANTTQATGGSAVAANTRRLLTLNAAAANLVVAAGDRLRVRAAATGTLANTVTFSTVLLRFAPVK